MRYIFSLALILFSIKYYSQDSTRIDGKMYKVYTNPRGHYVIREKNDTAYVVIEVMPEFPGGANEMMLFIKKNIAFPKSAIKDSIHGKVIARFIVIENGSIDSIKIIKPLTEDLNNAVINVIEKMPKWKPGTQNGKAVRVRFNLPVNF